MFFAADAAGMKPCGGLNNTALGPSGFIRKWTEELQERQEIDLLYKTKQFGFQPQKRGWDGPSPNSLSQTNGLPRLLNPSHRETVP